MDVTFVESCRLAQAKTSLVIRSRMALYVLARKRFPNLCYQHRSEARLATSGCRESADAVTQLRYPRLQCNIPL